MITSLSVGIWDYLLIVVASIHGTAIAYLPSPRVKAWLLCLPTTFSVSFLALGQPLGISNILSLVLLLLFTNGVRVLHIRWNVAIIPAIVICALGYCVAGSLLIPLLPSGAGMFWAACVLVFLLAVVMLRFQPSREECGHRSPLPVMVKFPIIVVVIVLLIMIKGWLQGFMTLFPMVGVVGAYEARSCLWTISRQIPIFMILFLPMLITMYLTQSSLGPMGGLISGWGVFIIGLLMYSFFNKLVTKGS
jgi:hypothetical protein